MKTLTPAEQYDVDRDAFISTPDHERKFNKTLAESNIEPTPAEVVSGVLKGEISLGAITQATLTQFMMTNISARRLGYPEEQVNMLQHMILTKIAQAMDGDQGAFAALLNLMKDTSGGFDGINNSRLSPKVATEINITNSNQSTTNIQNNHIDKGTKAFLEQSGINLPHLTYDEPTPTTDHTQIDAKQWLTM